MNSRIKSAALITALTFAAFVSLGLPDGLLGVAWPSIRARFDVPLDALGPLLLMFTIGYLVSSFNAGRLLARMGVGTLLGLSCLATSVSLIGYSLAPLWWYVVALGALAGLGAGAIDAGLNAFAAARFSGRMVNWLHACYGIGAAAGPAIMTSVLAAHHQWQLGYAIVGGGQLLLAMCFALSRKLWIEPPAHRSGPPFRTHERVSNITTLRLPVVWLGAAVFFVYTGIEAAAGAWTYSLFTESRGVSMTTAGTTLSIYWGSLTAGRLISGFIAGYVPARRLVSCCTVCIAIGAALVWLGGSTYLSFIGLGWMGLASAPIFPTMISSTPKRLGQAHASNAIGFQIAAAVLGQSMLPALIGLMARRFGLESVGFALFVCAAVLAGLHFTLAATSATSESESSESVRESDRAWTAAPGD